MCAQSFARAEQLPSVNRCRCSAVGRSGELGRAPGLAEGVWSWEVTALLLPFLGPLVLQFANFPPPEGYL